MRVLVASSLLVLLTVSFASCQATLTTKQENGKYSVYLTSGAGSSVILKGLPKQPSIVKVKDDLFKITESVGSPSSYTHFVDSNTSSIEGPFFLVQAINEKNMGIIYAGEKNKLMAKLLFSGIDPVSFELPDVYPVAVIMNAVKKVEFLTDTSIRITYYSGMAFDEEQVVVQWPHGK